MRTHFLAGLALALVTGGVNAPLPHPVPAACGNEPVVVAALDFDAALARLALPCGRLALPFALPEGFMTGTAEAPGGSLVLSVDGYPVLGAPAAELLPAALTLRTLPAWSAETLQSWQLTPPLLLDVHTMSDPLRPGLTTTERDCSAPCVKPTRPVAPETPRRVPVGEPAMLALLVPGLALVAIAAVRPCCRLAATTKAMT